LNPLRGREDTGPKLGNHREREQKRQAAQNHRKLSEGVGGALGKEQSRPKAATHKLEKNRRGTPRGQCQFFGANPQDSEKGEQKKTKEPSA